MIPSNPSDKLAHLTNSIQKAALEGDKLAQPQQRKGEDQASRAQSQAA